MQVSFSAPLWVYQAKAAWYFLSLPEKDAAEIKFFTKHMRAGWGSVPVTVTVGDSTWKTSLFPDSKRNTYILPMKKEIRVNESLKEDDMVSAVLEMVV